MMSFSFPVFFRLFSVFVYVFVLLCLWLTMGVSDFERWMGEAVGFYGNAAMAVYVLVVALLTALAVPRQVCSFFGGYVFGVWEGTFLATLGTGLSCAACFFYARFVGQAWLQRRFGARLLNFNDFLLQSPFLLTFVVRIIPLGSNFLTNFLAGISRIPSVSFLGASTLGFTVQNFIFALMGDGVYVDALWNTLLSVVLYVVSLSMGYWIYIRYKRHKIFL